MKNLRTTKIAGLFLSIGFACLLSSCDKNDGVVSPESEPVGIISAEQVQYDPQMEAIAKALAASMGEESVRTLIKTEALKKFDGDYDILYQKIGNQNVGGKTLSTLLNENSQKGNEKSRTLPISQFAVQMPLLNIGVPVNAEKWNTSNFEPLVVISPSSVVKDETKLTLVKAYDKAGKVHWLDAKKAPDFPVVVVGLNERVEILANGIASIKKGLIFTNNGEDKKQVELYEDPDGGGGGGGGGTCTAPYFSGIVLKGYNSGNISAIESWFNGGPEIRMTCAYANQNGNSVNIFGETQGNLHNPDRSWVNNTWWDLNDYLFNWQSSYGDLVTFVLWEEDAGTLINIPVTVKGKFLGAEINASFTINISDDNEWIGSFPVYREDFCRNKVFGNNSLYFKLGY